ncbi:MAG: hypothetical protein KAT29_14180 [Anaerolineales bacterium]|nr:hypothetical protein [Anaerolineales bacterium]
MTDSDIDPSAPVNEPEEESPEEVLVTIEPSTEESEPLSEPAPEPVEESRSKRFFRQALRVVLAFAIIIGIGAVLVIFLLYIPERQKSAQSSQDLAQANQTIDLMQSQIADLETEFQNQQDRFDALLVENQELNSALDMAELQVVLLSVRTDIANARLALAVDDSGRALLILTNTPKSFDKMEKLLPVEDDEIVANLRERLELVLGEIERDAYAAESDLDVLDKVLLELENNYFAQP